MYKKKVFFKIIIFTLGVLLGLILDNVYENISKEDEITITETKTEEIVIKKVEVIKNTLDVEKQEVTDSLSEYRDGILNRTPKYCTAIKNKKYVYKNKDTLISPKMSLPTMYTLVYIKNDVITKENKANLDSIASLIIPISRARSPGLLGDPSILSNSYINKKHFTMLNTDKKKLKRLVKALYNNVNYVSIKSNKIVIKKHWYSLNKTVLTLDEIFESAIPRAFKVNNRAKNVGELYMAELVNAKKKSIGNEINTAYEFFFDFIKEVNFKGWELKNNDHLTFKERLNDYKVILQSNFKENVVQYKLAINEYINRSFKKTEINISTLKSITTTNLISFEEFFNSRNIAINTEIVGRILTLNTKDDERIPRILRICAAGYGIP